MSSYFGSFSLKKEKKFLDVITVYIYIDESISKAQYQQKIVRKMTLFSSSIIRFSQALHH